METGQKKAKSFGVYPSREEHSRRWEELAREIAASRQTLSQNPEPVSKDKQGSLIILGSGIQGIGFTMEAEAYLQAADKVFYCVSNPPTQVWLHELRPDAYDLYVLYDDTKPRYSTYMQMTEAMLHYVRQGQRVVGVYYGHPGVFVLSTHRAIAIARREGHYAVMKPGISALDCLCADLGVDPAYPGMQTFEASEVLLRKRPLDTSIHVVLWQVGLIGEQGYRRKGFINDKFPILVEYLQQYYGDDYEVTHYVAARHATFEPTIAVHKLSEMLDPRVRATFSGISTFYIPPKDAAQTDPEMAARLGFVAGPRQKLSKLSPLRNISAYNQRELDAVEELENFRVSHEYQFQPKTRAGEFLVELTKNIELQDLYINSPEEAVSENSFPGLTAVEKHFLSSREENYAHVAAKGSVVSFSANEKFIIDLHRDMALASSFRSFLIDNYKKDDAETILDSWITAEGYSGKLDHYRDANERLKASMLLPWTGVYTNEDNSLVLTVIGNAELNDFSLVYANLTPVKGFTFNNSTLIWKAEDGNPNSASLLFKMYEETKDGNPVRSLSGKYWAKGNVEPKEANLHATEVVPTTSSLSVWTAKYSTETRTDGSDWTNGPTIEVYTPRPNENPNTPQLLIDGQPVEITGYKNNTVTFDGNEITFALENNADGSKTLAGKLNGKEIRGKSQPDYNAVFQGQYLSFSFVKNRWKPSNSLLVEENAISIGQTKLTGVSFNNNLLTWSGAGVDEMDNGEIQFTIDPSTQLPKFIGYIWEGDSRPAHPNIQGSFLINPDSTDKYAGKYSSSLLANDGTFVPSNLNLEIVKTGETNYKVVLNWYDDEIIINEPVLDTESGTLVWQNQNTEGSLSEFENAELQFNFDTLKGVSTFHGKHWRGNVLSSEAEENWRGTAGGMRSPVPSGDNPIPAGVFEVLGTIGLEASDPSSLFIWSRWQRACFTSRLANSLVPKICEAITDNKPSNQK